MNIASQRAANMEMNVQWAAFEIKNEIQLSTTEHAMMPALANLD